MSVLFLLIVLALSAYYVFADKKAPVSKENTYLLYGIVTGSIIIALGGYGLISLIIYYCWHTGKITKWYQRIK